MELPKYKLPDHFRNGQNDDVCDCDHDQELKYPLEICGILYVRRRDSAHDNARGRGNHVDDTGACREDVDHDRGVKAELLSQAAHNGHGEPGKA